MAYSCTSFPSCENSCGVADARERVPPGAACSVVKKCGGRDAHPPVGRLIRALRVLCGEEIGTRL